MKRQRPLNALLGIFLKRPSAQLTRSLIYHLVITIKISSNSIVDDFRNLDIVEFHFDNMFEVQRIEKLLFFSPFSGFCMVYLEHLDFVFCIGYYLVI